MSHVQPGRRSRIVATVGASALAASLLSVVTPTIAYAGTLPGTLTVTTPSNGKLAAGTAKQVIVLTISGTGATALTEDNVSGVKLGSDANCANISSYVVTSATTLTVKTPTNGCIVSPSGAEDVSILFNAGADTITKTAGLTFVSPPKIVAYAANTTRPVLTDNSADQLYANQSGRFVATGGQVGRVKAASDFAFDPRSASGLKVSVAGKDATDVKVYAAGVTGGQTAGTAMTSANTTAGMVEGATPTEAGNYLTFKTASGMDASNDTVIITQNGVSKSFLASGYGNSFDIVSGPTVTSLSPTFGKSTGGTSVTVTATGLTKTWVLGTDYDVYFCEKAATVGAVNAAGTAIVVTAPSVSVDATGLGATATAGACPVTVRTPGGTATYASPVTSASIFTELNE
ncbi:IPT/TIG domain-containing protein [Actinoplanes sp. L3-i22]|uniref:IPT/TIG domain-containing protein n=1 Tax=Actinoplanes sp. L3-i22 TaxID=2836373 RepID=UPI001C795115|nr:IPT/TIG domain-containing protein [Actinoplanes sp. L3-i22]BCY13911.1 hypothetical protein L3i22_089990 [Actinoplanes sp. L3-i22]